MTFISTDPQNHQSENTWFTPFEFKKLGEFDLDPCTVSYRPHDMAKNNFEYDKKENGLVKNWHGDVWLNPPYGKEIIPFIDKFIDHKQGVMLIFARMGSQGIQKLINKDAYFYFLRKRVRFIDKNCNISSNAGVDSCLVCFESKWLSRFLVFDGEIMQKY